MLTAEEVRQVALLARIGLTDGEVETYREDLSSVLDFFGALEAFRPVESGGDDVPVKENDCREDVAEDVGPRSREDIMKNVPVRIDGFVKVRSVF